MVLLVGRVYHPPRRRPRPPAKTATSEPDSTKRMVRLTSHRTATGKERQPQAPSSPQADRPRRQAGDRRAIEPRLARSGNPRRPHPPQTVSPRRPAAHALHRTATGKERQPHAPSSPQTASPRLQAAHAIRRTATGKERQPQAPSSPQTVSPGSPRDRRAGRESPPGANRRRARPLLSSRGSLEISLDSVRAGLAVGIPDYVSDTCELAARRRPGLRGPVAFVGGWPDSAASESPRRLSRWPPDPASGHAHTGTTELSHVRNRGDVCLPQLVPARGQRPLEPRPRPRHSRRDAGTSDAVPEGAGDPDGPRVRSPRAGTEALGAARKHKASMEARGHRGGLGLRGPWPRLRRNESHRTATGKERPPQAPSSPRL